MKKWQKVVVTRNPALPQDSSMMDPILAGPLKRLRSIKLGEPVSLPPSVVRVLRSAWTTTFDRSLQRRTARTYHVRRAA